ncbi:MAG TPA: MFS transporter [Gaiellaceae bacterium]|nr:MFS transporter [Gaiellaceae bacterium]
MSLSSAQLAPLRLPAFRNLFFATLGSSVGTLLAAVALAIDVKDRTASSPHSAVWVAAVLVVEFLPTIVVGLLLGPLLDRLERRSLMIAADAARVGVFVALPFASSAAMVVGLALVAGLATGFFRPAVYAGIPNLVPEEQLPNANALLQTVENLSWAVGPLLGGVLTAAAGPSACYAINAVSFVVSIVLLVRIPPRLLQSERALSRGHWRDLRDGFSAALRSPSMRAVLVAWGIASFALGGSNVATIFIAEDTLSGGNVGYGLLFGATGAGLVLGSFGSATALARYGVARVYGGGLLVMALGALAVAVSPDVWVAAVCCIVFGGGNGIAIACNALLVQRGTFDLLRGRALTFVMSVTYVLVGIGAGLGGLFLHEAGARWIWGVAGGIMLVAALAGSLLTRKIGAETASEAERMRSSDSAPIAAAN